MQADNNRTVFPTKDIGGQPGPCRRKELTMFPLERIVCPTDFSEPSLEGLRSALELAEKFNAELTIVHVIEQPVWSGLTYSPTGYSPPDITESLMEEATKNLNKLQSELIPEHVRSRLLTLEGKPADQIVRLAADLSANLIVIATHGYTGFHRFVFGSVTERVVRTATCPVLAIRPRENRTKV
jgi:universal stress protein A